LFPLLGTSTGAPGAGVGVNVGGRRRRRESMGPSFIRPVWKYSWRWRTACLVVVVLGKEYCYY